MSNNGRSSSDPDCSHCGSKDHFSSQCMLAPSNNPTSGGNGTYSSGGGSGGHSKGSTGGGLLGLAVIAAIVFGFFESVPENSSDTDYSTKGKSIEELNQKKVDDMRVVAQEILANDTPGAIDDIRYHPKGHDGTKNPAIAVWFNAYGGKSLYSGAVKTQVEAKALQECETGTSMERHYGKEISYYGCSVGTSIEANKPACITYGTYRDHNIKSITKRFEGKYQNFKPYQNFSLITQGRPPEINNELISICQNWHAPSQKACLEDARTVCNFGKYEHQ